MAEPKCRKGDRSLSPSMEPSALVVPMITISRRVIGSVVCLTMLALGTSAMAQNARQRPLTAMSVPVSASVLATIVSIDDDLMLLVLWRGEKGEWYSAGPSRSEGGGAQNGTFTATLQYGDVQLDLRFDSVKSEASVQGTKISMPPGSNVLLVDGVDGPTGFSSVRALAVDTGGANLDPRKGIGSLAPLLGRSPDVVGFLRCHDASNSGFSTSPCHDLMKR